MTLRQKVNVKEEKQSESKVRPPYEDAEPEPEPEGSNLRMVPVSR